MKRKTERRVEFAEIGKKKKRQAAAAQVACACQPLSFFPSFHSSALRLSITLSLTASVVVGWDSIVVVAAAAKNGICLQAGEFCFIYFV